MKNETALEIVKEMLAGVVSDNVELVGDKISMAKKSIQAFFNTEGGTVVFGITKERGFCHSLNIVEIQEAIDEFLSKLNTSEPLEYISLNYQGHDVLIVNVERLPIDKLPCHLDRNLDTTSLFRMDGENIIMPYWYLHALRSQKEISKDEQIIVGKFKAKYDDPDLFAAFCSDYKSMNSVVGDLNEGQLMDYLGLRNGFSRTVAYVLSFCLYPQMYFPNLVINLYDTSSGRKVFVDSFDGTISAMWQKAVTRLKKLTGFQMRLVDGRVIKEGTYPVEVMGELVFNALVHRDYSSYSMGEPIRVYINKDGFVIENPGHVISNGDILQSKIHFERNPFIKKINDFILSDQLSIHGFGMVESICQLRGFDKPIVTSSNGSFSVKILRRTAFGIYKGYVTIEALCRFCSEPKSKLEIFHEFSHRKDKSNDYDYFISKYINPLLSAGVLKLTIPEKPKSKFQKIYTEDKYLEAL
jgi:ATP-dependent DNA helicase RecG